MDLVMSGGLNLLGMLVKDGTVTSIFPTTGRALLPATATGYAWANVCAVADPATGQPRADSVQISLGSPRDANVPVAANQSIAYVVSLQNLESRNVTAGFTLAGSAGLILPPTTPSLLPPASTTLVTITGNTFNLGGLSRVTVTLNSAYGGAVLSHLVDGTPPTVSVFAAPGNFIGPGVQLLHGNASDAGSHVSLVEISINGAAFQPATGTAVWSLPVVLASPTMTVRARATDAAGLQSALAQVTLKLDATPPSVAFALPAVITPGLSTITGTATEAPNAGVVQAVETQIGDENAPWETVTDLTGSGGAYQWRFGWPLPYTDVAISRMRVRARDAVGNLSTPTAWQTTTLDSVPPKLTIAPAALQRSTTQITFNGTVSDNAGVGYVEVIVYAPDGTASVERALLNGSTWSWAPGRLLLPGAYALYARAADTSGNYAVVGPVSRTATAPASIYLPMMTR